MARDEKMHVTMFPWSAFGHMVPYLQLAVSLAKAGGIQVSLISTPNNIKRLPSLPPNLRHAIDLVAFPLPQIHGRPLPENAEATVDVPFEKTDDLKIAFDGLREPFEQFVTDRLPDWIFLDYAPYWAVEIAREHRIPVVYFSPFSAASLVYFGAPENMTGDGFKKVRPSPASLTEPPPWVDLPSAVAYRSFEAAGAYPGFFLASGSGLPDAQRYATVVAGCQAVALRSCREFEGDSLNLGAKILGKPVIPVGLLPPERPEKREITDESWIKIFKWLDNQENKSVVFVGFGSECKLTKTQVHEIAHGLQLSDLSFLWSIRKPNWAINESDILPPDFLHKTSGKGLVQIGWCPQVEILAHPSIGGSLFHSGWGSAIETLAFGHCLVVLPLIIDQPLNARLLVERGLAIEVERSEEDGSFGRDGIAKALREAMVSEEAAEMRSRAREASAMFGDLKLHEEYVIKFVEYLRSGGC